MKTKPLHIILFLLPLIWSCHRAKEATVSIPVESTVLDTTPIDYEVKETIKVADYFAFMDSLVAQNDTHPNFRLDEHLIVRTNPWIINRLAATDYYRLKQKGIISLDQRELVILRPGDRIRLPDFAKANEVYEQIANTVIDINLPEFQLRIIENDSILYSFPVRIGQRRTKYLAMAGRNVDLRTRTGVGYIFRINKNPAFINPANNHPYEKTRRDDGEVTALPLIPWLEPIINEQRYGQLIHPTTNPITLGRTSSNGCIGTTEGDAWYIYYYAPIGTRVVIRYDRKIIDSQGDTIQLPDIYPGYEKRKPSFAEPHAALPFDLLQKALAACVSCIE